MVVRRRKKSRHLRGRTRTMGWGRIGQHRGSGSRGGFGAAGMHKHMWTWVVKYAPTWFGKHGFNRPQIYELKASEINVGELAEKLDAWLREGVAKQEEGKIVVNLAELGYAKLLGRGKITRPVKVIVPAATERAVKKIEEAGGEVVILKQQG
ncbi:uL15 family ribosomal protein [Hyperthermus butylicus]|uniref:Large ribosomal subunit protein uL15 n=1 Tax=Hyperthermus butylicus (strain DSM 5456 / JCM 9403 / PLM1-5) TaxID=415426 RepID=RL15_HYPBU|nr:uL15 family ribosomal protein [Hyperthermus butylicus]A2BME1.1 RecName: Full=Large ribosomal subunit protein uL15; AltName: Full=50S ribosomal protein L15 [Hyperthermus butylicus DSM 5456]ABM81152.1 50S ribosomal protein L15P [Hyperthermus butylicus DSM 5456]